MLLSNLALTNNMNGLFCCPEWGVMGVFKRLSSL